MPNDPKWRTIARVSGQPISAVLAVYIHLLVIASTATERGRTQNVCNEDLASALDLDTEQIDSILSAMQGRVLDGDAVSGWAKRQVEREDGSAERAKRWREAQKEAKQTKPNATERKQTPDTDTDTDTETTIALRGFDQFWLAYPKKVGKGAAEKAFAKARLNGHLPEVLKSIEVQKRSEQWQKDGGQYIPNPATWLNQKRWEDGEPAKAEKDWI
jgi:hypothetical protein